MAPTATSTRPSPFLQCGSTTQTDQLAILHLKRDLLLPIVLRSHDEANEGYKEGKVTNTRFGSFPHSTLIDIPWGSQVRASAVDTGSRGRKGWEGVSKKRKRGEQPQQQEISPTAEDAPRKEQEDQAAAIEAKSGFIHVLPPTPELWTASLPHRTQVVYTPDYSYILHRIRARPGTRLIEAGAGSGSFTHAAARAVYYGYPPQTPQPPPQQTGGKIFTFEFHSQRHTSLHRELLSHNLSPSPVTLTHADVCTDGFLPTSTPPEPVNASAIFLDLPAPWLALKHLTRSPPSSSVLNPHLPIHICTFSPCIEQVQRTHTALRSHSWTEIETVELQHRRLEARRERVGLAEEGLRGVSDHPCSVEEAVGRLREVEGRTRDFHAGGGGGGAGGADGGGGGDDDGGANAEEISEAHARHISKQTRLADIKAAQAGRKLFKEGRLVTRSEAEVKTHTSYLTFAVLPRAWSAEDEAEAKAKVEGWCREGVPGKGVGGAGMSKRARKKAARMREGGNKGEVGGEVDAEADRDGEVGE